jgi:nucleoside-diphosphate-sugar epimerase
MNNQWEGKKVLVTGGTGFMGKYLVDELVRKKADVRAVDFRRPQEETYSRAEFLEIDIRNREALIEACQDMEYVFHLAAMPSIARGKKQDYFEVNVGGTENIVTAAWKNRVKKFLHVSSSTVYGVPGSCPLKENSPVRPIGKYGRSKLGAEQVCRRFAERGMNVTIIRPRVIIGPGRIGIFSILFNQVIRGGAVYILGNGKNQFQFTHVGDMVNACLLAAQSPGSDLFNVGSVKVNPVRDELKALIQHARSKSRIISVPAVAARVCLRVLSTLGVSPLVDEQFSIADKDFVLDTRYAQEKLRWQPEWSNTDALLQAFDWYRDHIRQMPQQYNTFFGVFGKFKHSHMGGFQK